MLPQSSHIVRKNGVYFFRRRIPGKPGAEIALSLRTKCFREAQWLATSLARAFDRIVLQMGDTPDIAKIIRKYLKDMLDWDMEDRVNAEGKSVRSSLFGSEIDETPQGDDLGWIERQLERSKVQFVNRRYDEIRPLTDQLMLDNNVPPEFRRDLAHGLLQASIQFWEVTQDRTLGKFPQILLEDDEPKLSPNGGGIRAIEAVPPGDDSPLFSAVLPAFLAVMSEDVGWSGQTRAQNEATYRLFVEVCSDKCVKAYARRDLGEFYQLLRKLPALYSKLPAYRGKTPAEIVALAQGHGDARLSMRTIKRHFAALSRLFGYGSSTSTVKANGRSRTNNRAVVYQYTPRCLSSISSST